MPHLSRAAVAALIFAASATPASADVVPVGPASIVGVVLMLALLLGGVGYFFYWRRRK